MASCSNETRSKKTCGRRRHQTLGSEDWPKVKRVKMWTDAKRQRHPLVGMTAG